MKNERVPNSVVTPRLDLSDDHVNQFCDTIRECGFGLHRYLGAGFREKVYERGMIHRMREAGLNVQVQPAVKVFDEDGTELIEEVMDLIVEDAVILEMKAVKATTDTDVAQLLGYLKAAGFRHGLLINFGAPKYFIKKYVM